MAARMNSFEDMEIIPSRPVSDDEDDEQSVVKEDEDSKRKIYWIDSVDEQYVYIENENQQKMVVDELIVGDGQIASAFLYTYFLIHYPQNVKILGQTSTKSEFKVYEVNYETSSSTSSETSKTPVPTFRSNYIYLIHLFDGRKVLICQLFNQLKSNELYDWLNQLWAKFEYKSSLIISSQNRANYFTSKDERFPCVKYVTSNAALNARGDDKNLGRLEEPNFLNELPAAIIHFGLGKKIPFTALVCYTSSLNVELQSVKEIYRAVSSQASEKTLFIDNDLSRKTLLSIENAVTSTSGLYI